MWLAAGGKDGLKSDDKCRVLHGRNVRLYPDADAYELWRERGAELGFEVSDYLERYASAEEKARKIDVGDWLVEWG